MTSARVWGQGEAGREMTSEERDEIFKRAEKMRINGDYEAARPLYEELLGADENDHGAVLGLAYCQLNIGEFEEAIETFQRAKAVDPTHVKGRLELAKSMAMLAMYDEAKTEFLGVLELDPENEDALEQLEYFPDD